jgi:superfamily II DNA or RNA helicase
MVGARREAAAMITLRPDQLDFVERIRAAYRGGAMAVLGCAPTGMGKTVVSAYIARAAVEKKSRVLFTVHRTELMYQTSDTFAAFGISHGFIKSGMIYDPNHLVHIASIDTLRNRLEQIPAPNLLVVDECHLARAAGWHRIIACCRENGARVLGNSGSPHRLDGKSLGDLFDALVVGPSTAELIAAGHLSRFRYFAPNTPDMTGARKQLGDYTSADASAAVDIPSITGNIVGHWKKYAQGMRTICFTISHKHSEHIIEAFRGAGVTAEQISSKTPPVERKRLINAFADGEISVLCNVELITTGFDLAAQVGRDVTVEAVIMARPTMSLALYLQMVGRALRRKPNPAVILDHAGNSARHGFPDEIREWSLDGDNKEKAKKKTQPPVTCEVCFMQVCRPLPPQCTHCGTPWPEAEMRPIVVDETAELVEVSEAERRLADARKKHEVSEAERRLADARKKHEVSRCQSLEELVALGAQRGYKPGWAQHIWQARQARRA